MKIWLAIPLFIGALVALWVLRGGEGKQTAPVGVERPMDAQAGTESGGGTADLTPEIHDPTAPGRGARQPRNPEVSAWLQRSGFTTEYNIHFSNREFLESQAANGDMLAAQTLGYQTLGTPRSIELLTDAARWGSLQALHYLSSASSLVADGKLKEQRESQVSRQDQHEHSLKALEYLFVAEMRGDTYAAPSAITRLLDRFSYTESDISQACHQAADRYEKLEQSRMAEGMAPFDNSSPSGVATATDFRKYCSE